MAARRNDDQPSTPRGAIPEGTTPPAGQSRGSLPASPRDTTVSDLPSHHADTHARDPDLIEKPRDTSLSDQDTVHNDEAQERAVVDARRRGWFWHWNSVVTQYAPLIGLKGVGLLNSYTVWTDRRDESPHRGYAFPSQQSEADFYGEERSELITINKILVALDLIEIRKEMVLRTDERGRRWRVPHNLYRVKDRPEGASLRVDDVLRVTYLARDDAAVYRYVRRIFSPRFKPIDRDNAWHAILAELADHPLWREMRERTEQQESRASARSKAGHRTRTARDTAATVVEVTDGQLDICLSSHDEHVGLDGVVNRTSVASINTGSGSDSSAVAGTNDGSSTDVAGGNGGCEPVETTFGAMSNTGCRPTVAHSNTTYHQPLTTTTTTTSAGEDKQPRGVAGEPTGHNDSAAEMPHGLADFTPPASGTSYMTEPVPEQFPGRADRLAPSGSPGRWVRPESLSPATTDPSEPRAADQAQAPPGTDGPWVAAQADGPGPPEVHGMGSRDSVPAGDIKGERGETGDVARRHGVPNGESGLRGSDENEDGTVGNVAMGTAHPALEDEEPAAGGRASGERTGPRDGVGRLADTGGGGPLGDPSPLVVSLFEAANDRRSSALERILLAELERDADPAARSAGSTGAGWVAEALREAVGSGSAFVAPKRIREIITRWSRESAGPDGSSTRSGRRGPTRPSLGQSEQEFPAGQTPQDTPEGMSEGGTVRLPGGADGASVWQQVLDDLRRALDPAAFERLLDGSLISRFQRGVVEVRVPSPAAADKLSTEYRSLVERHLNERLPRPVSVTFLTEPSLVESGDVTDSGAGALDNLTLVISKSDYDLASRVWQSLRDDLASSISKRDLDSLGAVVPLGEDASGVMLLGVQTSRSLRLIDGKCRAEIERAMSALIGRPVSVRAVPSNGWTVAPPE